MRRQRIEVLLIGLTVLGLTAGLVGGMLVSRLPGSSEAELDQSSGQRSPLAESLQLTPRQSTQMRVIWEDVRAQIQSCYADADDINRQRDDAVLALLDARQKEQFEKLTKVYADKSAVVAARRNWAFAGAVEQTRQLLNDAQRRKYDEMLQARVGALPSTNPAALSP